jgi:predicted  nucleic acid-binding Zn-ribbon protein
MEKNTITKTCETTINDHLCPFTEKFEDTKKYQMQLQKQINDINKNINDIDRKIDSNQKDTANALALYHKESEIYAQKVIEHSERLSTLPDILNDLKIILAKISSEASFSNSKIDKLERIFENHEKEVKDREKTIQTIKDETNKRIDKLEKFQYWMLGGMAVVALVLRMFFGG